MIDLLNAIAAGAVEAGRAHFVQVAVLALLLAVVDATLGRRLGPTWRCALWLIFFLKLALPPQLSLPTSPAYWWTAHKPAPTAGAAMRAATMPPIDPAADAWAPAAEDPSVAVAGRIPAGRLPSRPGWQALLVLGWAAVAGVLGALSLRQQVRLRRVLRDSEPAGQPLLEAAARAAARVKPRGAVEVRVVNADLAPLVTGLIHPVIHLPRSLLARLAPDQLHAVLVHELWHVRRGDLWVAAAQGLARVLFFHHPAVWWVNAHVSRLREEATDRAVLTQPEVSARSYSLALVEAAELLPPRGAGSRFALGVIETKSQLRKRITMNLHHPRPRRAQLGLPGLLLLAAFALLLIPMAPAQADDNPVVIPPGFKAVPSEPLIQRIDATTTAVLAAFNRRDRDAYLGLFTDDALMLPDGDEFTVGKAAVAQGYLKLPSKLLYDPLKWGARQVHVVDRWVIDTGVLSFQFRLSPDGAPMSDPRQGFTIWQQEPDGSLKVKLLAWNKLVDPGALSRGGGVLAFAAQADAGPTSTRGDFGAIVQAEQKFHQLFHEDRGSEAARYYSEGATLITPAVLPLRGRAAIARHLAAPLPDGGKLVRLEQQVAHVEGNAQRVLVVNLFRWTFQPPGGSSPVAVVGKGVHVWQKEADGEWRILFDLPSASQRAAE